MDLATVPILDQHCHALLRDGAVADATAYARFFTESDDATPLPARPNAPAEGEAN